MPNCVEPELLALERALRARRLFFAVLRRQPLGIPHVHDEPAVVGGCEAGAGVLEPRLGHGAILPLDNHDEPTRPVDALDPLQLDVGGRRGA